MMNVAVLSCFLYALCVIATNDQHLGQSRRFLKSSSSVPRQIKGTGCTAVSNPPKGALCGVAGHIRPSRISAVSHESSLEGCLYTFLNHDSLRPNSTAESINNAFQRSYYNTTSGTCGLIELLFRRDRHFKADPASDAVVYDDGCFTCPNPCKDPPFYKDLVGNGGFEQDIEFAGPWELSNTPPLYGYDSGPLLVTPGSSSRTALYFRNVDSASQPILQCKNLAYRVTFDYKLGAQDNSTKDGPSLEVLVDDMGFHVHSDAPVATKWRTFSFYTLSGIIGLGGFVSVTATQTHLDNFQVYRVPAVPSELKPIKGAKNLIKNPGFETGLLSPWYADAHVRNDCTDCKAKVKVASPGIASSKSLHWIHQAQNASDVPSLSLDFGQTVAVAKGRTYMLSFDAFTPEQTLDYYLVCGDLSATVDGAGTVFEFVLCPDGKKRHFSGQGLIFYANSHTMKININGDFGFGYDGPPGQTVFDNFELIEVDI